MDFEIYGINDFNTIFYIKNNVLYNTEINNNFIDKITNMIPGFDPDALNIVLDNMKNGVSRVIEVVNNEFDQNVTNVTRYFNIIEFSNSNKKVNFKYTGMLQRLTYDEDILRKKILSCGFNGTQVELNYDTSEIKIITVNQMLVPMYEFIINEHDNIIDISLVKSFLYVLTSDQKIHVYKIDKIMNRFSYVNIIENVKYMNDKFVILNKDENSISEQDEQNNKDKRKDNAKRYFNFITNLIPNVSGDDETLNLALSMLDNLGIDDIGGNINVDELEKLNLDTDMFNNIDIDEIKTMGCTKPIEGNTDIGTSEFLSNVFPNLMENFLPGGQEILSGVLGENFSFENLIGNLMGNLNINTNDVNNNDINSDDVNVEDLDNNDINFEGLDIDISDLSEFDTDDSDIDTAFDNI